MLSLHSLGLSINGKSIFKNLSVTLLPSSILYLQGDNGAGKTSLLRMLAGIQKPSSGKITIGKDQTPLRYIRKPYCNYIGHQFAIKPELSVYENISFFSKLYGTETLLNAAITYMGLERKLDSKCYLLSAGNQKKVAIARLLACRSKLWLLDEADSNLDQETKNKLLHLIISHADSGGIVVITTHSTPEIKSAQFINLNQYKN
ncbi:MAG: heme ABC exporter ATP-binding protein CcmA [Rickettsiales bacterium]|nr:heme ABC exporter ATP-binding protein CcmA [Rickettsiales bacterium]